MPHFTPWIRPGYDFEAQWFARRALPIWERHILPLAPFRRYLEIGTYNAQSLTWTAFNLLSDDAEIVCIDNYRPVRDTGKWRAEAEKAKARGMANIAQLRRDKPASSIRFIEADSGDALCMLIANGCKPFDYAYVDGDHRAAAALLDMTLTWRLLAVGGYMCVDDTHLERARRRRHDPKTKEAVEAFLATHLGVERLYDTGDQVCFRKIRHRLPKHPPK